MTNVRRTFVFIPEAEVTDLFYSIIHPIEENTEAARHVFMDW